MDFDDPTPFIEAMEREGVQYVLLDDLDFAPRIDVVVCANPSNVSALRRARDSENVSSRDLRFFMVDAADWNSLVSLRTPRGIRKFRSFEHLLIERSQLKHERDERIRTYVGVR